MREIAREQIRYELNKFADNWEELDSLAKMEVIADIEDALDINTSLLNYDRLKTERQLYDYIEDLYEAKQDPF